MFVSTVSLVLALATSAVFAVPTIPSTQDASDSLPFYFPESTYQQIPYDHSSSLMAPSNTDPVKTGVAYLCDKLNLTPNEFKVYNNFTDSAGVTHVYGAHLVNDARVSNHQAAIHIQDGQIISYSTSFGTESHFAKSELSVAEPKAKLTFEQVADTVSKAKGLPVYSEFKHELEYVQQADGTLVYAYKFQLRDKNVISWIQVWADADTGKLIQAVDFGHRATYKAIKVPDLSPNDGFSDIKDPEYKPSSPNGWTDGTVTQGNNIDALDYTKKPPVPATGVDGVFDTKFNPAANVTDPDNIQAAAVNLFYITNLIHDITYQYGFNEAAGNFQKDNFGKGGKGGDAVNINVLDTSSAENALFHTPADGQPGIMLMFRFISTEPNRNGGLDNQVPLHEYGHGISTRLTGGSAAVECLFDGEAEGMGEGWSDIFATIITAKQSHKADTPIGIAAYVDNTTNGVRSHPYTTDMKVNPLTYADLQTREKSHVMGEVWASILWEVYWNLVTKNGFSTNLYDAKGKFGNIITMQNMIGGMMLQPCHPTFLDARDAFIASDVARYNGANKCEIWKGFAKRGLGVKAAKFNNDFSVPDECSGGTSSSSSVSIATTTESTTVESATVGATTAEATTAESTTTESATTARPTTTARATTTKKSTTKKSTTKRSTTTRGPKPTSGCTRMDIYFNYIGKSCDQN
ncbi:hypothetical protein BATDEDRAFT_28410 [Batrachochytrium dendrobatidis JAM81]|uniref:Extracellular metalloproteinase n=2 Tax=Batrachochytrium dendrobatidis TaxID=109871 RepID=F4PE14_BATDJ|nr:uncharacterized protein BATDEDRAFT_28410 [Batrachochytrium dendrobatidis JAM81]EGF76577.1 hypothetical protein BATDEDRAFT_28410 [Batrachochytrium dendrobatidis JAM81]OAJ39186.1 hypothetical protein BDEG_23049 [Batrachochytrium dendrobatidis JEL423]|eukprot:XP_006682805.1 hypothetical protein BATDEDRAFT_28410 [Batrachochytrium dendrobatidis JAM81]